MIIEIPDILYGDALMEWWDDYKLSLSVESTIKKENVIYNHLIPDLGNYIVHQITRKILYEYVDYKRHHGSLWECRDGLSNDTLRTHFNIIRPSLQYCVEQMYALHNAADKIKIPRDHNETQPYTIDEIRQISLCAIKLAENGNVPEYMPDVIALLWRTGVRRSELFGVRVRDIDLMRKCLCVSQAVTATSNRQYSVGSTKTPQSRRAVLLDNTCIDILSRRITNHPTSRLDDYIFCDGDGSPINPYYSHEYYCRICKAAGVGNPDMRRLRTTHATLLAACGVPVKGIQTRLGHASDRMTNNVYIKYVPIMQETAISVLNKISVDNYT